MQLNSDWIEMLQALHASKARFLVVGAHAVALHGRPRATADLDLWVDPAPDNAPRVYAALKKFGAPLHALREEELTGNDLIFQIGVAPIRVDILTGISGVDFNGAWKNKVSTTLGGQPVFVIGRDDLIANKRASGRNKDLADLDLLV